MLTCFIVSPSSVNAGWLDIINGEILHTTGDLPRGRRFKGYTQGEFKGPYSIVQIVMSIFSQSTLGVPMKLLMKQGKLAVSTHFTSIAH
jgi:hypothetical protein